MAELAISEIEHVRSAELRTAAGKNAPALEE